MDDLNHEAANALAIVGAKQKNLGEWTFLCACYLNLQAKLEVERKAREEIRAGALSAIAQIYGLIQECEYDKVDDYCRCAAERYAP